MGCCGDTLIVVLIVSIRSQQLFLSEVVVLKNEECIRGQKNVSAKMVQVLTVGKSRVEKGLVKSE